MSTTSKPQARPRETLNIRIRAEERGLIDRAAAVRGTNRTDFILDAARSAAEDALLDQSLISVGPKAYAEFIERLDPSQRRRAVFDATCPIPFPSWSSPALQLRSRTTVKALVGRCFKTLRGE